MPLQNVAGLVVTGMILAGWSNASATGIDAGILVATIKDCGANFAAIEFAATARNLQTLELLMCIEMVLKFRVLTCADEHQGLFAVDWSELTINKLALDDFADPTRCFANLPEDDFDDMLDKIVCEATGVALQRLEPLCITQVCLLPLHN